MKKEEKLLRKSDFFFLIPVLGLILFVGTITNQNIFYTTSAGALGGLIGFGLKKLFPD